MMLRSVYSNCDGNAIATGLSACLQYYHDNKPYYYQVVEKVIGEEPAITALRHFYNNTLSKLTHCPQKNKIIADFIYLLINLPKPKPNTILDHTIERLKIIINKNISWGKDSFLQTLLALRNLHKASVENILLLLDHQNHAEQLEYAIDIVRNDASCQAQLKIYDYWNRETYWTQLFDHVENAGVVADANSILVRLAADNEENIRKIYAYASLLHEVLFSLRDLTRSDHDLQKFRRFRSFHLEDRIAYKTEIQKRITDIFEPLIKKQLAQQEVLTSTKKIEERNRVESKVEAKVAEKIPEKIAPQLYPLITMPGMFIPPPAFAPPSYIEASAPTFPASLNVDLELIPVPEKEKTADAVSLFSPSSPKAAKTRINPSASHAKSRSERIPLLA